MLSASYCYTLLFMRHWHQDHNALARHQDVPENASGVLNTSDVRTPDGEKKSLTADCPTCCGQTSVREPNIYRPMHCEHFRYVLFRRRFRYCRGSSGICLAAGCAMHFGKGPTYIRLRHIMTHVIMTYA